VNAVARALSPRKLQHAAPAKAKGVKDRYLCTPCALVKKELVLRTVHTCKVTASEMNAAMALARSRMPAVQKGREFKLKEYLRLSGVRGDTHWGVEMKEHTLLKSLKWDKCGCEKCRDAS
jgi:hypothetical protein